MSDQNEYRRDDDSSRSEADVDELNSMIADEIVMRYPHAQAEVETTFLDRDLDTIARRNYLAEIYAREVAQARERPDVISTWNPPRFRRRETEFDKLLIGLEPDKPVRTSKIGSLALRSFFVMGERLQYAKAFLGSKIVWKPKD